MADPHTPPPTTPGTTTPGTTANPHANTTTAAGTTPGATVTPEAKTVRPIDDAAVKQNDNSATKGLIVGVLTFLVLSLWEWLDGPTGAEGDAITFPEMAIYAVVGIIVGVVVKAIDKSRAKSA